MFAAIALSTSFAQEHQQYSAKEIGARVIAAREQAATSADAIEQQLIEKQKKLTAAEKAHDKAYVNSQLAPEFNEISPDGKMYDKAAALANFDLANITEYQLSNFKVITVSPTIGIVTFNVAVQGTFRGEPASGRMYVSCTWVKQGDEWKVRFAQVTPMAGK